MSMYEEERLGLVPVCAECGKAMSYDNLVVGRCDGCLSKSGEEGEGA